MPEVGQSGALGAVEPMTREGKSGVTQPRGPNTGAVETSASQTPVNLGASLQGTRSVASAETSHLLKRKQTLRKSKSLLQNLLPDASWKSVQMQPKYITQ